MVLGRFILLDLREDCKSLDKLEDNNIVEGKRRQDLMCVLISDVCTKVQTPRCVLV